jgi:hypothetical protein
MTAAIGVMPGWGEKLDELFEPLLPGSEQFKLQQRRAIETSGVWLVECAFLQQSGMFVSGHEPSPTCAPMPTAPQSMVTDRAKAVSHLRIGCGHYIERLRLMSSMFTTNMPLFS